MASELQRNISADRQRKTARILTEPGTTHLLLKILFGKVQHGLEAHYELPYTETLLFLLHL